MKTLSFLILLLISPKVEKENIFIEFKEKDILRKNFVLSINTEKDISEKVTFEDNRFLFNDATLKKEGRHWLYIKNDKLLFKTNLEMKEIIDVSGKVLYKSKALSKNRREWINTESKSVLFTTQLLDSSNRSKKINIESDSINDITRLLLIERLVFARNLFLSNTTPVVY